jgi:hypothetical protein
MPRKILQLEERIIFQSKRLGMTIDEVKKTIDDEDGNLRSEIKGLCARIRRNRQLAET